MNFISVEEASIASAKRSPPKPKGKNPNAVSLGKRGGLARAKKLSPEKRSEIAKKAAEARWGKKQS